MIIVLLAAAAFVLFAMLMLALVRGLPRETLDEQAEAIRRDAAARERRRREKAERKRRKAHV